MESFFISRSTQYTKVISRKLREHIEKKLIEGFQGKDKQAKGIKIIFNKADRYQTISMYIHAYKTPIIESPSFQLICSFVHNNFGRLHARKSYFW